MPRTIVDIPADLTREVDRLCRSLNISRAEAVRRGLSLLVEKEANVRATAFGLWQGAGKSREELVGALRANW